MKQYYEDKSKSLSNITSLVSLFESIIFGESFATLENNEKTPT